MIKVRDIAYVRLAAPDLDAMERFLIDFGLSTSAREGDVLYARGTDGSPYCHITERGEPAFLALAFEAASADDLIAVSKLEGASGIEAIAAPGGGQRVRFTDPDGYGVEIVHGREPLPELSVANAGEVNLGSKHLRLGAVRRAARGPASVKRLGHAVVRVSDFCRSQDWYRSRFGFVSSDEVYLGERDNVITAFLRCDRGDEYTDHHTLLCVGVGEPGFDHAAFEVEDLDAVMIGHDHLVQGGYQHHAGVGRHVLGSQIFDYWQDPWGRVLEHFTDGDLLNDTHETASHDPATALGTQWGQFAPRTS